MYRLILTSCEVGYNYHNYDLKMEGINWDEIEKLKQLANKYAWCDEVIRNFLEKDNGVSIRKANFYSSSPSLDDINQSFEYDKHGNSLPCFSNEKYTIAEQLQLLGKLNNDLVNQDLADFCSSTGFQWKNGQFDRSDALHYWGIINMFKPKTILEIGSGWSSRVAAHAAQLTGSTLRCIDPSPRAELEHLDINFQKERIQNFDPHKLSNSLSKGDILFIDSSHSVKTGNDVVFIYCILFPLLPKGLIVHIHDLYLPYGRPRQQLVKHRLYWYEDYFTQILISQEKLKPILANHFLHRSEYKDQLLMTPNGIGGASIWFEVC